MTGNGMVTNRTRVWIEDDGRLITSMDLINRIPNSVVVIPYPDLDGGSVR